LRTDYVNIIYHQLKVIHAIRISMRLVVAAVLLICTLYITDADSGQEAFDEYKVKAAFLLNFINFIEWPEEVFVQSGPDFNIAILGEDPFGSAINTIAGKPAKGRTIRIKRIAGLQYIEELKKCHIVFVSNSQSESLSEVVEALQDYNVLIIGDTEGFARMGCMINLTIADKKVHFEVNIGAADRAGLKISSKLLKLAKIVAEELRGEGY